MSDYTNFDLLLYAATEQYCDQWTEELCSAPSTNEITPRERRRFNRIRRRYGMGTYRWTPWKVACVIVLLCMSISFTACMCIPTIRSAIKKVFVEWYSEYVSVDFKDTDETEPPETETTAPPPATILRKAYVEGLPEGYTAEVVMDSSILYCVSYSGENKGRFILSQQTIRNDNVWFDGENQNIQYVMIRGHEAALIKDDETSAFSITWQDNEYQYTIEGISTNEDEIIKLANNTVID